MAQAAREPGSVRDGGGIGADDVLLVGPTGAGKSAVALELAPRIAAEIISVDSMQVYRGLDIGTAKPGRAERARVPHHLIDILTLDQPSSVAAFVELARSAHAQIRAAGKRAIFCGGSGLYFKALLEGLGGAPAGDLNVRRELEARSNVELLEEIATGDAELYQRIDRHNRRRLVRAVEVLRLTGKPFSAQRADWQKTGAVTSRPPRHIFGLQRTVDDLRGRIEARVDEMFARGLVAETQAQLAAGLAANPVALQAIGYRQVTEYLAGNRSLPETVLLVKRKTREYAKRQMTWFRRQLAVRWIEVRPDESGRETAAKLANFFATQERKEKDTLS